MNKLVYVLPSYSASPSTHYGYLVKQLEWLSKHYDLKVLIERQESQPPAWLADISITSHSFLHRLQLLLHLKKHGFKKIYLHYSHFTLIVAKLLGFTTYFWHCEIYQQFPLSKSIKEYLLNTWPLLLAFKLTDYLVTGDDLIKAAYHQRFNIPLAKIKVIPNWVAQKGPTLLKSQEGPSPKNKKVLFVHHLSPRKGTRELPAIIKQSLALNPQLSFTVIGSGPDEDWLKSQLKDLPVKFIGSLPQEKLSKHYQTNDLFILPSKQEGFPRVVLEAMSHHLPIVSFNVGNVKNLIPTKMIATNPKDFIKKIINASSKPVNYPNSNQYTFKAWQRAFTKNIS